MYSYFENYCGIIVDYERTIFALDAIKMALCQRIDTIESK